MNVNSHNRRGTTNVELPYEDYRPSEMLRLTRLGRELRLTDQILSMDMDTVSIVEDGPAPAWTTLDGDAVFFSMEHMPRPVDKVDVAVWLGTNAHELGHVLFSPRRGSILMQRVIEGDRTFLRGLAQLHNIAEDQRQERLLLAKFSPWTAYLTAALGHHLVADNDTAWLLMCGRTWLPDKVRAEARARFTATWGQASTVEVAQIIGEYQSLTDPGDTESAEAWTLLERLHNIFDTKMPWLPQSCTVMVAGEPDTGEAGDGAPMTADEADEDSPSTPAAGSGDADGGDEGDEDPDENGSGSGAGDGPGSQTPRIQQQAKIRKDLKKAAKEELDGDAELDDVLDALRYGRAGDDVEGGDPLGQYTEATDSARRLHHEVGDALLDLKDQSEPGWVKKVDSGRLNVRRVLNPSFDADELFDRYEPGQMDASELEVVLLLDVSGSMHTYVQPLAEAAWAIRSAVDDIEGECTVITWDSGPHRILAAAGQRPDGRMFVPLATGGTDPHTALREGFRLLADSRSRNRLLIVMTDGDWFRVERAHDIIRASKAEGITTICALLGAGAGTNLHECEFGGSIDSPTELAMMFRRIAAARIGAWR